MKTILVTGGAGFIGSHLVDRLLADGDEVICIDNFDPYYPRSVKENNIVSHLNHPHYSLIEEDIRNLEGLRTKVSESIDAIVHLAAKGGVRPSIKNPVEYQEVNVMGTQNMLEFAKERGIKQFIFSSSSSVYGTNENVPWSEDDHVLNPISPYAGSKVSGELLGHVYSQLYDIRFLALRLFTVYGPRQRPDLAIHKFLRLMSEGEEIEIYGDGSTRRDYTYIEDIVNGLVAAISFNETKYEVINLGNNQTVQLMQLVDTLEKVSGFQAKKVFKPEQPGDVKQTWADISKAQQLLGYNPDFDLKKGLINFAEWYKSGRRMSVKV